MEETASIIYQCADEALSRVNFVNKSIVYQSLNNLHGIKPTEIGEHFHIFHETIKQLYGDKHIEIDRLITQILHEKAKKNGNLQHRHEIAAFIDITNVFGEELKHRINKGLMTKEMLAIEKLENVARLIAIGKTANMVGHDIRNPLQVIVGDLFLLDADAASLGDGETKSSMQESINSIRENVQYINKIVLDLQDYSRPLTITKEKVNVKRIIEEVSSLLSIPDNIKIVVDVEKNFSEFICDSAILKRILTNLVYNAIQAMPNGGTLTIEAFYEKNHVIIFVKDTGVGIPEDVRSKLFTPMFTTKARGQGFGLVVVKRMIEALDGTVTFESEVGKGTKFKITLPM